MILPIVAYGDPVLKKKAVDDFVRLQGFKNPCSQYV